MRCFTATYKNKKFQQVDFLLSTLVPDLTELSKVFQAVCFDFAQMKASVELWINKLSDAGAKSELKANCENLVVNYRNLERWMVWMTRVCQVAWRFGRVPKAWQIDRSHTQKGRQE